MKKNILVVEDEARLIEIVTDYLEDAGFNVIQARDGKKALEEFESNDIDLVILDIMLPELDGWTVCRRIRKKSGVPIIMLTAREEEDDKLMGFELGADEYVTKPYSPKVLVARVKTLIKRIAAEPVKDENIIAFPGLEVNVKSYVVKVEGAKVDMTPKEFDLLIFLLDNRGIVLTRESILNKVWGYDFFGELRVVDSHIKKLRKKLGSRADYIKTVVKVGYKFEVE